MKKPVHFSEEQIAAAAEGIMRPPPNYKSNPSLSNEIGHKLNPAMLRLYLESANAGHTDVEIGNALGQFFGYWICNIAGNIVPVAQKQGNDAVLKLLCDHVRRWAEIYSSRDPENSLVVDPSQGGNA